ncbi:MAG: hypothetical protein JXM70_16775 [Pirellulales bacterium]|nr:hypothetical protein [Pirellulales bacterium]
MQTRHVLIALLILAHVLVGLVVWSLGELPNYGHRLFLIVVATSQANLLAVWTALGRRASPWRVAALVSVVVGWSWIISLVGGRDIDSMFFLLPIGITTVGILVSARFLGLGLYVIDTEQSDAEHKLPWQFSLARLFAWTTSLSVCLGLLSITLRHCRDWENHLSGDVFTLVIGSTIVTLICLWLTLTDFRRQLVVALLVVLLFGHGLFVYIDDKTYRWFFVLQIPLIAASLLVFRIAGYRLKWKRKNLQRSSPSSET